MPSKRPVSSGGRGTAYSIMCGHYGRDRAQPRLSARHARERTRASRGGRLRRRRARRALRAGVHPERIFMHGNNKSEVELELAFAAGVGYLVVDSLTEIERSERMLD